MTEKNKTNAGANQLRVLKKADVTGGYLKVIRIPTHHHHTQAVT